MDIRRSNHDLTYTDSLYRKPVTAAQAPFLDRERPLSPGHIFKTQSEQRPMPELARRTNPHVFVVHASPLSYGGRELGPGTYEASHDLKISSVHDPDHKSSGFSSTMPRLSKCKQLSSKP